MRVNSLTLSETPGLRKRNREDEDYSFRVDKMSEQPASVPRSQATLTAEEYMQQQAQHHQQQGFIPKDDSFSVMLPFLLPHSNSTGSGGSGSLMNLLGSQDSLNQDPSMMQQGNSTTPTPGMDKTGLPSFMGGGGFQPAFALNGMGGFSFVPSTMQNPSLNFGSQNSGLGLPSQSSGLGLQAQNSGLSLPSQTSGLLGPTNSGLSL